MNNETFERINREMQAAREAEAAAAEQRRLAQAAPELLAALKALLPVAEAFERQASRGTGGRRGGTVFARARAAIAKAEGGAA